MTQVTIQMKVYDKENVRIYVCDCVEVLRQVPDQS